MSGENNNEIFNIFKRWKVYLEISQAGPIIRRYFVMNFFDGVLTALGIVLGFFTTDMFIAREVLINTVLFTAIAIGISGLTGSYLAESTERKIEILELKKVLGLSDSNGNDSTQNRNISQKELRKALGKFEHSGSISFRDGPKSRDAIKALHPGVEEKDLAQYEIRYQEYLLRKKQIQDEKLKKKALKVGARGSAKSQRKSLAKKKRREEGKKNGEKQEDSLFERSQHFASTIATITDALSPFMGVIVIIIPFLIMATPFPSLWEYIASFIITGVVLFALGAFLARLSRSSILRYGLIMILSGVATSLISILLGA